MTLRTDQPFSLTPEAARKQAEVTFGEKLEALVHRAGARVVDVERGLGLKDAKIYRYFRGLENFRAAWLALLPPAVELEYLAERAAHHAMQLSPVGDATSPRARFHAVIVELADVTRGAALSEADGHISPEEAEGELREIEEAERGLSDRKAMLRKAIAERGLRVAGGSR